MIKAPTRKTGLFRIILLMLLSAAIIAAAAFVIAGGGDLKSIAKKLGGAVSASEYHYANASGGSFGSVGGGLAVLSPSELHVFDGYGAEKISKYLAMSAPALTTSGKYGAAYDIGGTSLVFFSSSGVISDFSAASDIISASVSDSGYLAVCTEESGWGGSVTVYNRRGTAIYKWYSGSAYVLSASVRGRSDLLVLTVGKSGSDLVLLRLSSEEEKARFSYDGLIVDARLTSSGAAAVTSGSLMFFDNSLKKTGAYDFGGRHLSFCSLKGDNAAVVTGEYQYGGAKTITSVSPSGAVLGTADAEGDILSLDAAGKYTAVLYSGSAAVYGAGMSRLASFDERSGASSVVAQSGGGIIAAGPYSAYVHIPKPDSASR